jgi:hypothetical protein
MKEIAPGIWHWKAKHPKIGVEVSSYFLSGPRVLLDPMAPDDVPDRLEDLGPPAQILLTNRHHYRDCQKLHERFGCGIRAPRPGMHEFGEDQPVEPYDFGEALADGAITAHEVGGICPDDAALYMSSASALAVADGVISYDGLRFVPDNLMDEPEQTKEELRAAYRGLAAELAFDNLLPAHGEPVIGKARDELRRFAES